MNQPPRIPPCMGGFCPRREGCARYQSRGLQQPAERLCQPGGADVFQPLRSVVEPPKTHRSPA